MRWLSRSIRLSLLTAVWAASSGAVFSAERFFDDFEGDLSGWRLVGGQAIRRIDSGDPEHGQVLELTPDGLVYATVIDSQEWGPVRIEADVLFPDDRHNYLGLVYNLSESDGRVDFGSVYVKGNGSYLRGNPWRDGNASRLLYEEYKTPLEGPHAIEIGRWQRFRAEIEGRRCHIYVGEGDVPQLTFDLYEGESGEIGFKARIVGYPVWIDNVRVTSIEGLSYRGESIPSIAYRPVELLTDWEVHGPLAGPNLDLERGHRVGIDFEPFATDRRGAVVTGRVTEYNGDRTVAYFRTEVNSEKARDAVLHISSTEELALFLNGRFWSFVYRDGYVSRDNDWNAWFDFWSNPRHAGRRVPIRLEKGTNEILLRSRSGYFASGGFFARLEDQTP